MNGKLELLIELQEVAVQCAQESRLVVNSDLFLNKINEIRSALNLELYNCALALALTLPDICGKVAFPFLENKSERYKLWFNQFAKPLFTYHATKLPGGESVDYAMITGEECWKIRCAVLHAGNFSTEGIDLSIVSFHAQKNYSYVVRDACSADFDGVLICETLCDAAECYYNSIGDATKFTVDEVRVVVG